MTDIQLPTRAPLNINLELALQTRRSVREYTNAPLDDAELAALLWACAGITDEKGHRTTPSTRDLRAVSPYVLRADGVWRWDAEQNKLIQLVAEDVRAASTEKQFDFVGTADVTIVLAADHERAKTARPTGIYADAGAMAQTCQLAATALHLASCIRASFDHARLHDAMALEDHIEPILLITCGRPL